MVNLKTSKAFSIGVLVLLLSLLLVGCRQRTQGVSSFREDLLEVPKGEVLVARVYENGMEELHLLSFEKKAPKEKGVEVSPQVELNKNASFYPVFRKLTQGFVGQLTNDLKKMYFVRQGDLYEFDIASKKEKLLSEVGGINYLTLSPDEKRIAFCSELSQDIYIYDLEKKEVKKFADLLKLPTSKKGVRFQTVYHLEWLADDKVVFTDSDLKVLDVKSGEVKPLTQTENVDELYFSVSPDKNWVVFYDFREFTLYLVNLKTKELKKIEDVAGYMGIPYPFAWSSDGKLVAFEMGGKDVGFFEIWVLSTEKGKIVKKLKGKEGKFLFTPFFSPDGKWLIYQEWVKMDKTGKVDQFNREVFLYLSPRDNLDKRYILFRTSFPDNGYRALDWK